MRRLEWRNHSTRDFKDYRAEAMFLQFFVINIAWKTNRYGGVVGVHGATLARSDEQESVKAAVDWCQREYEKYCREMAAMLVAAGYKVEEPSTATSYTSEANSERQEPKC